MGNHSSSGSKTGHPAGPQSIGTMGPLRKSTVGPRRPMPDEHELERRFNEVLLQMDLPPERAKHLRSFDSSKKWDIICDQVNFCNNINDSCDDVENSQYDKKYLTLTWNGPRA